MRHSNLQFYYFKENLQIKSKLEALEYEKIKKKECTFFYNDHIYSHLNWKKEPDGSLFFHYKNQAERLRDVYDYLILCYSGGIDSTNILETFFYNNIKLDKILSIGSFSQDSFKGDDTNRNGEIYYNVIPYIEHLGLKNILQIVDYTKYFSDLKKLSLLENKENWIEKTGSWFSPHHWFWRDLICLTVPEDMKKKRVGIIFGRDKPVLDIEDKKYFFRFLDTCCDAYISEGYDPRYDKIDIINFYWDPEYPWILLKQLHIIKKFIEFSNSKQVSIDNYRKVQVIDKIDIHSLVYNLKKPLDFIGKKSSTGIISVRDTYLINKKNSDLYDIYNKGIKKLYNRLGTLEIPGRFTKKYYIN